MRQGPPREPATPRRSGSSHIRSQRWHRRRGVSSVVSGRTGRHDPECAAGPPTMRQLLPTPVDPVGPMAAYGDLPVATGRPAVRLNMIASVDGATTLAGVSGGLGGRADHE